MREILFRGKCLSCKKFKYGDLVHIDNETEINALSFFNSGGCCCDEVVHVDTDTVGQYTGLTDKNGVKIFEGDIIRTAGNLERLFVVCWSDKSFQFVKKDAHFDDGTEYGIPNMRIFEYEVVGNIYDNPELLGGDEDA